MTRKRRVSEIVPSGSVRDPLNLKGVSTDDDSCSPVGSLSRLPQAKTEEPILKTNSEKEDGTTQRDLSKLNSVSSVTSPRFIKPLLARNPKDPLDLLSSADSAASKVVTRAHKVVSPALNVESTCADNLPSSTDLQPKQLTMTNNNRKRRRNRSSLVSEFVNDKPKNNSPSPSCSKLKSFISPPPSSSSKSDTPATKSAKKSRASRRNRKRRHTKKHEDVKRASDNLGLDGKKSLGTNSCILDRIPMSSSTNLAVRSQLFNHQESSLSLLFLPVQSIFSKSKILHIGSCGDNGLFTMQLFTQYGANHVVGLDRSFKRVKIARHLLGSLAGQISLFSLKEFFEQGKTNDSTQDTPFVGLPVLRCFASCYGPLGPNSECPKTSRLLRSVEFHHVLDYSNIQSPNTDSSESPSRTPKWDVIVIQEKVFCAMLSNSAEGPFVIDSFLDRVSAIIRPGGHLILVIGRMRWRGLLKRHAQRFLHDQARLQDSSVPDTELTAIKDKKVLLHPINRLRKFHNFRLVRKITSPYPTIFSSRSRQPSGPSTSRGVSPFLTRSCRNHLFRPQSGLSTVNGCSQSAVDSNGRMQLQRRHGGSHRIAFVLHKKSDFENSNA